MQDLSHGQQVSLVLLRTLVGWHFLYEGFFKLWVPAWSREGVPLGAWTSAGYLRGARGPLGPLLQSLSAPPIVGWLDLAVSVALVLVGLSLLLGLYTSAGCAGALCLLALFYLSAIPTGGVPAAGSEGAYLFVNKNLVEAAGVLVVLLFRTERIAGLDLLRGRTGPRVEEAGP